MRQKKRRAETNRKLKDFLDDLDWKEREKSLIDMRMEVILTDDEYSEIRELMDGRDSVGIYKVYDGTDYCEIEKANLIADKNILSMEEIYAALEDIILIYEYGRKIFEETGAKTGRFLELSTGYIVWVE